jgi:UDP-glucose 4-epimerase
LADNIVPGFKYEYCKVQEKGKVEKLIKKFAPDVIFHMAAIPRVAYSVENPYATVEANVLGTVSMLEGVLRAGLVKTTRVVSTSSSSVYGGADKLPTPEDWPASPQSPYAMEKHQGEEWCRLFSQLYGMSTVSLRYFNVFGPYSVFGGAYSTVLSAWLYSLYVSPHTRPFMEGNGKQSRDFCYVDNVVQANILAGTAKTKFQGEAFNIAQGKATTLLEVKVLLEELSGRKLDLEMRPPRAGDVMHTLADISAAQKVLGYKPTINFKQQVATMAEWYRTGYPGKK